MRRIMFVCTGNTCRSPMAEIMLKTLLKRNGKSGVAVTSSGLDLSDDKMNPNARKALKTLGFSPRKFIPKLATKELVKKQNAVICMTAAQKSVFHGFTNIYTISELTGMPDIPDPYGKGQQEYDFVAKSILQAVELILKLIEEDEK